MLQRVQSLVFLLHTLIGLSFGAYKDDVTFSTSGAGQGYIYDEAPKLKLKGSGFEKIYAEIDQLELVFDPPIKKGDVFANVGVRAGDMLVLDLLQGKRWMEWENRSLAPRPLYLEQANFKGEALLDSPVKVAVVIPTPTVYPSMEILYLKTSPNLRINGTNFNVKETHLFFNPPLASGVDISIKVMSPKIIMVSLVNKKEGRQWGEEPGPLKLVAIDTGAGPILLRSDLEGVTIAEMQSDLKGHSISVETHEDINIYQSAKNLAIAGTGFRPDSNAGSTRFRFGNTLTLEKNYTVKVMETSAIFTLVEGSKWRQDSTMLPSPLVLLAADAGDGWVPLGATGAKAGRKVAMVYEDPRVEKSDKEISRTETHDLTIKGSGFAKSYAPKFVFDPHMEPENYVVHVLNRTHVTITLASADKGWMDNGETGYLNVVAINTGAGMLSFPEAVPVAIVVDDDAPHHSGIAIKPNYMIQLYQSSIGPLIIEGENFPLDVDPELTFGFAGPTPESVSCKVLSTSLMQVKLSDGYTWSTQGGPVFLTKVKFGEHELTKKSPGLKIATINEDPFVQASQLRVYASHTKHITIQGHGFMSSFNPYSKPTVVLSPTLEEDYVIKDNDWNGVSLTISLNSDKADSKWAEVAENGDTVAVKVVSIDTGAGVVEMPGGGIVVADVRADDATFSCDDSCIYSNDGQCDEDQGGDGGGDFQWMGYSASNAATSSSFTNEVSSRGMYAGASDSSMPGASDDMVFRGAASCELGTDCTDCGFQIAEDGKCDNTCPFARDGTCDDRRATGVCADGTDCQDCGPWGASNFTQAEFDTDFLRGHYDDDDNGFLIRSSNHPMLNGQDFNAMGRFKRVFQEHRIHRKKSHEGAAGVFMETLWAAIVIVGFSVVVYLGLLGVRCAKGQAVELPIPTNPDVEAKR